LWASASRTAVAKPERRQRTGVTLEFRAGRFIDCAADTAACDEIRVSGIDQPVAVGLLEDVPQHHGDLNGRFQLALSFARTRDSE
jgi:hypothetical protein